ncbi:MAG: formylglycine-generating enzyme family protein [Chitinophagales bacterium]|nr:formylglycine-generating enzyme family protein [Chitinophagales bacterium]
MKRTWISIVVIILVISLIACNKTQDDIMPVQEQNSPESIHSTQINTKMVYIPGGEYRPFYSADSNDVFVAPFLMDERPVTNQEFLEFVKANPQWRRSNVKRIYADSSYLKYWQGDLKLPQEALPDAPVTYIPWFAAKAFAESVGKRLPTLDEWEFLAMADQDTSNARTKKQYSDDIINLYLEKDRQYKAVKQSGPNYWGVYNMFDLIWEWTDDFNSVLIKSDSRVGEDDKGLFCAAGGATTAADILNYAAYMRFALRASIKANYNIANLGFRCAKDTIISPSQNQEL